MESWVCSIYMEFGRTPDIKLNPAKRQIYPAFTGNCEIQDETYWTLTYRLKDLAVQDLAKLASRLIEVTEPPD